MEFLGGQALIEGVLMKGPEKVARAVYNPDGELILESDPYIGITKKYPRLNIPILRGFLSLIDMLRLGFQSLLHSMRIAYPEEAPQTKREFAFSLVLSMAFSIGLFVVVPATFFKLMGGWFPDLSILALNSLEGLLRISIFLIFIMSTLWMNDMRRMYEYHGAEHKTVNAHEAGVELDVDSVGKFSRIHVRCGTSFLMVVFMVSIIVFSFLGRPSLLARIGYKMLLFPLISGISYEIIRLAARNPKNMMWQLLLWPGLGVQFLTTREPDKKQLAAAIAALKKVL